MKRKQVVLRSLADRDIRQAVDYYLGEGAQQAALKFVDALEVAFQQLAHSPASGSPRYAHALDLPDLRCWPVKGYPHLIFYIERDDDVDVWRVLHGSRDIPAWMQSHGEKAEPKAE